MAPTAAGQFLKSTAPNAWGVGTITSADLPAKVVTRTLEQSDTAASPATTSSTVLIDAAGYPDYVFNAPQAGRYLVHVDASAYISSLGGASLPQGLQFGLRNVTTGVSYDPVNATVDFSSVNAILPVSFRVIVDMAPGNNTLRLRWRSLNPSGVVTIASNGNCKRAITITR
jgi:hypothetical protein